MSNTYKLSIFDNETPTQTCLFAGKIITTIPTIGTDETITAIYDNNNINTNILVTTNNLNQNPIPDNILQPNTNNQYYRFSKKGATIKTDDTCLNQLLDGGIFEYYNLTSKPTLILSNDPSDYPNYQDYITYNVLVSPAGDPEIEYAIQSSKLYIKIEKCVHPNPLCFNKNTKILCINDKLEEEYRLVQDLVVGDIVKSYKHGNRPILGILNGFFINNPKINGHCMFKISKTNDNELTEDLIVTGHHSILVDERSEEEEKRNPKWANHKIDDKYRVVSSVSNKFDRIMDNNQYTYYHFSLKTDDNKDRPFGVWANGLLVECTTNGVVRNFNK
jgi:hypothetical protein